MYSCVLVRVVVVDPTERSSVLCQTHIGKSDWLTLLSCETGRSMVIEDCGTWLSVLMPRLA